MPPWVKTQAVAAPGDSISALTETWLTQEGGARFSTLWRKKKCHFRFASHQAVWPLCSSHVACGSDVLVWTRPQDTLTAVWFNMNTSWSHCPGSVLNQSVTFYMKEVYLPMCLEMVVTFPPRLQPVWSKTLTSQEEVHCGHAKVRLWILVWLTLQFHAQNTDKEKLYMEGPTFPDSQKDLADSEDC